LAHLEAGDVIVVFGAGLSGYSSSCVPDEESAYGLKLAAHLSYAHSIPVIITAGYSHKHQAHMGQVMREWVASRYQNEFNEDLDLVDMAKEDYAAEFNSIGEARAFWKRILRAAAEDPEMVLDEVHVVTRGIHSWRTTFLIRKLCPRRFSRTKVYGHQAPSREKGLWLHESRSWIRVLWLLASGKLKPVE